MVFVRHDSTEESSPLRPSQPGHDFKAIVTGEPDLLVTKQVNSCFHGRPDLDAWLRERQLDGIVLSGITTNHCCETTARVGGNLGHQVLFALDATHAFDRVAPDGSVVTADELARVTAANLHGEFATVVSTAQLLAAEWAPVDRLCGRRRPLDCPHDRRRSWHPEPSHEKERVLAHRPVRGRPGHPAAGLARPGVGRAHRPRCAQRR